MNKIISFLLSCLLHTSLVLASTYNLRVELTPNGAGSLNTTGGTYEVGESIYLRSYNNTGFVFKGWYEGDSLLASSSTMYYTMPAKDVLVHAKYEYDPTVPSNPAMPDTTKVVLYSFTASVSPEGAGTLNTYGGEYEEDESLYLRAYQNTNYYFKEWVDENGKVLTTSSSFYYTMPSSDTHLTAVYYYDPTVPSNPDSITTRYTVNLISKPNGGGTFNTNQISSEAGNNVRLYAYTNTGFQFKHWENESGDKLSTSQTFDYTIPNADSNVYGVFEYNPQVPSNPNKNNWDKSTGEVIVDDFKTGSLNSAISQVTDGNSTEVTMITVSGKMSSNDFGIANNYSNCSLIDLKRTYGFKEIPSYAYDYNSSLQHIILPSCVEQIGYRAFYQCSNLSEITCYAIAPPEVESNAFTGIAEGAVLHVLSSAIPLYAEAEGWKNFTILPLTEEVQTLEVNLPAGSEDGRYKNMTLELVNAESGQKQKYVISDRVTYTFNGLLKKSLFNVYVKNNMGAVLGLIENIAITDDDVSVTFESLLQPQDVTLSVQTPDGTNVTSQVQIRWFDSESNYLQQSNKISGLLAGTAVRYRITLPQALGMQYIIPTDSLYTIQEEGNALVCTLQPLEEVTITGRVKDVTTGSALSGAVVSISQKLNGLYSKAFTVKTDNKGEFTAKVFNDQSTITVSASDYLSQSLEFANFNETTFVGEVALKGITGATITTNLTYTTSVVEGGTAEVQNWYADYANVAYEIYNETQQRAITQFNVQYPSIVLLEEVAEGDVLKLTASSRTNAFVPVTAMATIDAQNRAETTFNIVELGAIRATFTSTDNASVVGILYDNKGQLVKKYTYGNALLSISNLAEGDYTLVTMTNSTLFNSILNLSQFAASGLVEGTDYVLNTVTVKSGVVATIVNNLVPVLNESKLYYTGDKTFFSVNKTSIVAGNYLTLKGKIDFKSTYAAQVSNVNMVVDLPETCSFVENSVMVGSSIAGYTLDGNRLTIPLTGKYTDQVRFCIIPTLGGEYAPNAFAQFSLDNKDILQPIGSAKFAVKDLTISVPSTVAKTTIPISGTALGNSTIEVFDNGVKIGETTSLANGVWSTTCELDEPYNLSTHSIYAKVTTKQGLELQSETQECLYDRNAIQVSKVTMYHWNPEMSKTYVSEFDFLNPKTTATQWTVYYPKKVFTYTIEFTANDPERISNVILYVHTADGKFVPCNAEFDERKGMWYTGIDMGTSSDGYYPVNCSVDFDYVSEKIIDNEQLLSEYNSLVTVQEEISSLNISIDDIYKQIKEELKRDDIDFNVIDRLNEQLETLLGISNFSPEDVELDENELYNRLEVFRQEYDLGAIDSLLETTLTSIEYNIPEEFGAGEISVSTCYGYDLSVISEDSTYVKLNVSGNKLIYSKATEFEYILLDFEEDVCYKITFNSDSETKYAPVMFIRSSANDVSQIQNYSNTIGDKIKAANELLNKLLGAIDEVVQHIEGGLQLARGSFAQSWFELKKLKQLQAAGENIASNRIFLLELTCDGWETQIKTLEGIKSGLTNLRAQALGKLFGACGVISNFVDCKNDLDKFINLYYSVPQPCKNEQKRSDDIRKSIRNAGIAAGIYYVGNISADVCALFGIGPSIAAAPASGGSSLAVALAAVGKISLSYAINAIYRNSCDSFISMTQNDISSLQCDEKECGEPGMPPCPNPNPSNDGGNDGGGKQGGGANQSGSPGDNVKIDPAGYVYEAVPANRVEGVQATIYYKETVEDMYGDLHENVVLWDAEQYAQENPLFTDENGMYRWDVPQGLWQVKFEKEGYETTYSDWLPVPPPQLEVNIAMTQTKQPEVKSARAYEDGIEVEFDKYMQLDGLTTENIFVIKNGETAAGTVKLLNEEQAYEDNPVTYASKVRFVPENSFLTTDEVVLTVSRKVKSYAGIQMESDYSQEFDIEKEIKSIIVDSLIQVSYNGEKEIVVSALPYDAAIGKKLIVNNSSSMILSVSADTLTFNENGQITLSIVGELPGTSMLSFIVAETDVNSLCAVQVTTDVFEAVETPVSSLASGTAVYRGTSIELSTGTKDAVIYYTLDGNCPCEEQYQIRYTSPIAITDDSTVIKAIAVADGKYDSDVVEFNYTIRCNSIEVTFEKGWNWVSHNLESPLSVNDWQDNSMRIVSQSDIVVNDSIYGFVGTLDSINPKEMYKVEMLSNTKYSVVDYAYNPSTPLALKSGWNWIGYPLNQILTLDEAFANADVKDADVLVGQDGFAEYVDGKWIGTIQIMTPGKGYMYKANKDYSLVYNNAIVSKANTLHNSSNNNLWVPAKHNYPNIMCVIADLYLNDELINEDNYSLVAFSGEEYRGMGELVNGKWFISVYGIGDEDITFKAIDNNSEEIYDIVENMDFKESVIGSYKQTYSLHMGETSSLPTIESNILVEYDAISGYLNISSNGSYINQIVITDTYGRRIVVDDMKSINKRLNVSSFQSGIYIVTISHGNGISYHKILISN